MDTTLFDIGNTALQRSIAPHSAKVVSALSAALRAHQLGTRRKPANGR